MKYTHKHLNMATKAPRKKGLTTQAAKAKGRRGQKLVAAEYIALFKGAITHDYCKSVSMGSSGDDVVLSAAAKRMIKVDTEVKNVEKLSMWEAIKQARKRRDPDPARLPIVVAMRNRQNPVAVLPFGWLYNTVTGTTTLHPECCTHDLKAVVAGLPDIVDNVWHWMRLLVHDKAKMPFWDTVLSKETPRDIVVFNKGNDPGFTIHAVVSWAAFLHVLRWHGRHAYAQALAEAEARAAGPAASATGADPAVDATIVEWPTLPNP